MKMRERNRKTGMWRNLGFTMNEIVMTVAIVSAITAVAVPNYMRIKMNTNMEMVKQHLKRIGESMTEIMAKQGVFPEESQWGSGTSPEETSVTASLNAIDAKQYTKDGYSTSQNRTTYTFRTCPKDGSWGISGDRCFILDPLGIREEAAGAAFAVAWANPDNLITTWSVPLTFILEDKVSWWDMPNWGTMTMEERINAFINAPGGVMNVMQGVGMASMYFNQQAYGTACPDASCSNTYPAFALPGTAETIAAMKKILSAPSIVEGMKAYGVEYTVYERPRQENAGDRMSLMNDPNGYGYVRYDGYDHYENELVVGFSWTWERSRH